MTISFMTSHGDLSKALEAMTAVGSKRPIIPAAGLVRIKLDWSDDRVTMETFDFHNHVAVVLGATLTSPTSGAELGDWERPEDQDLIEYVLVGRTELHNYVRSLTAGSTKAKQAGLPVHMKVDGGPLILEADGYQFTLPVVTDEFVQPPIYDPEVVLTVDRDAMLAVITRLQVSASSDDTLPALTAINMVSVPGGLQLCTTDRYRLSVAFIATVEQDTEIGRLVSAKELATIFRYLPAGPVECGYSMGPDRNRVSFRSGPMLIATAGIDSEFPRYQSMIPGRDGTTEVVVSRSGLAVAVRRASTAMGPREPVRVQFHASKARVEGRNADGGRMASPWLLTEQDGPDMVGTVGFSPQYIADALAMYGSDAVSIRFSAPHRPIFIAEPGELDNPRAFRTLVMPARIPAKAEPPVEVPVETPAVEPKVVLELAAADPAVTTEQEVAA